uniref:Uncharacterized protein n=2 Tax=Aegilops tauschii subsp. strangulata TaxID=200361 RepID=A0A452ZE11_AEGTS
MAAIASLGGGLDSNQCSTLQRNSSGQLEIWRVFQLHVAGRDLGSVGACRGRQLVLSELLQLLCSHGQRALAIGISQHQAHKCGVLLDDRPEKIMPRRCRDEGADRPHDAELEPAIGIERLRHAPIVLRRRLMLCANRLAVNPGAPEDHTVLKRAPVLCPPFQEHPVLGADIPGRELDVEVPHVREAPEHLRRRVVRELREERPAGAVGAARVVEGLDDREEHQLEEVGEDVPGLGRGQVEGVLAVAVDRHDAVDLDADVVDVGHEPVEPLGRGGAAAEGTHVLHLVEDEKDERVRQAVEEVELEVERRVRVDSGLGKHRAAGRSRLLRRPPTHPAEQTAPRLPGMAGTGCSTLALRMARAMAATAREIERDATASAAGHHQRRSRARTTNQPRRANRTETRPEPALSAGSDAGERQGGQGTAPKLAAINSPPDRPRRGSSGDPTHRKVSDSAGSRRLSGEAAG